MAITDEVLNELLKDYQKPEDLLGQHGLLKQLQKRLLEKPQRDLCAVSPREYKQIIAWSNPSNRPFAKRFTRPIASNR